MLIDETFFKGNIFIANVDEPNPDDLFNETLKRVIDITEEEVLSFAFGVEMWMDFKEKYQLDSDNLPQNYKDILNGKVYTKEFNGKQKKLSWRGLIDKDKKVSLLAYYAFVIYQIETVTQTTAFGQVKIDNKVGNPVSISPKVSRIYNDFLEMLQGRIFYSSGLTYEYNPYWVVNNRGIDYFGRNEHKGFVSLMQFLSDNKENYPLLDAHYRSFGTIKNEFGL